MKNKLFKILFIIFFLIQYQSLAESRLFSFETKTLEISNNGDLINASDGKAVSIDKNFEITAKNFEYLKKSEILNIYGNGIIFIKSNNLIIEFDKASLNEKNLIFEAFGNIKIKDTDKDLEISSQKIIFDFKNNILTSPVKTAIKDNYSNNLISNSIKYEIDKEILKINELNFTDKNNINLNLSIAFLNTGTKNLYGKDVYINLKNKNTYNANEPRLKGNSIINNEKFAEITNGVFTTCKKRDGCPPWEIAAKKIIHNKKNKTIEYKNAFLKVYDKPIAYFPKFSHPDPTVDRKSGFLVPSINNSNNDKNYITLPYYLAISKNKDITFSPRFYDHEEILLQTEYREANLNSNHISDFSFKANNNKKLQSHFFYNYEKKVDLDNFVSSNFNIKIQATSKDTYIKKNKIKSEIANIENTLENSAKFGIKKEDMWLNFETIIYENLDENESDRFEFLVPKIDLTKKLNFKNFTNGDFILKSSALTKNYDTNITETVNINNLIYQSYPKISNKGINNNYELILKNVNTNASNSSNYKNNESSYMTGAIQFNSSLPMIKENENSRKILNPKLALRLSPNYTKDIRNKNIKIDINNVYSANRISEEDVIEGGLSLSYGNNFSIIDKDSNSDIFSINLANNLRLKENNDLPKNSQIGQKTSSFFSEINYKPIEEIEINYNNSIKNNLSEINYENFNSKFKINNIVTTFDYLNENENDDQISYLSNKTDLIIDNSSIISFASRKNKTINLTEYYSLAYQYKNDCLAASIEYNKEFYQDRDLRPNKSIFFKLSIIPFNKDETKFLR